MTIAQAFVDACREELLALKPGNVHVHAAGHGMSVNDFLTSADAAAPHIAHAGSSLGQRILRAVRATREAVDQNTNLGIVLLCAPLAMAAEQGTSNLQTAVASIIGHSDLDDAEKVFEAIRIASPGGLGDAPEHDVREAARVTLTAAMSAAAHRDSIARQWATGYRDIFGLGLSAYMAAMQTWRDGPVAALATYLCYAEEFPDSHVLRKHGASAANIVQAEAASLRRQFAAARSIDDVMPMLRDADAAWKSRGINPGTSADLTVATGFAYRLSKSLRRPADNG